MLGNLKHLSVRYIATIHKISSKVSTYKCRAVSRNIITYAKVIDFYSCKLSFYISYLQSDIKVTFLKI